MQYRFNWDSTGEGDLSNWSSSTSVSHSYSSAGTYLVKAQARCSVDISVVSKWSSGKIVSVSIASSAKFLTLPFAEADIRIQQGWRYTAPIGPNPDDRYAHNGIDYIMGEVNQAPWQSFDVLAASDGLAMQSSGGGYGSFVLIRHDETGADNGHYFTLYAHLDSVPSKIPFKPRWDKTFSSWTQVDRGEKVGTAGATGVSESSWVHLHFEVLEGGYAQNKTDPYDIYKTRSYYPDRNNYTSCGPRYLWTTDPPSLPSLEEEVNCEVALRRQDTSTLIDTVLVNDSFSIYAGASSGNIDQVRFSSDENQDSVATGRWTDWYEWDKPSGDWNAETRTMAWTFTTSGTKEVCVEIRDGNGSSTKCFADISVQAAVDVVDERKTKLTEALWTLQDAMSQKVDYDVNVTAQAFTNVKDYWRVKRWADIFRVPLRILEDTISILTRLTDWRNIKHLSGSETACQVLLTMAMIQDLRQIGSNLVCALDGPTYIVSVEKMLEAADATTAFGDFSPNHYGMVVENWLNGLGEVPVLLLPEKVTRGVKQGFVAGALAVKLNIANQFNDLTSNVLNTDFPADFPFEEITAQIREIAREIIASSADEQTIEYPVPSTREPQFRETKLGAVAGLYRAFGEVAGCVAEHVKLEQTVEVIKLLETGTNAILLYTITYKVPGAEDVRVAQQVFTLAGVLTGSYVHTFVENPENRFYTLPQEMLHILPVELTNLWMVADGVVSYIEDSLR